MKVSQLASFGASSDAYVGAGISDPDPQGVAATADGSALVADAANRAVLAINRSSGTLVWSYTSAVDPALQAPVSVRAVDGDSYLITDRDANRVFIVDSSHVIRWQYGTTGLAGAGVNQLNSPVCADACPDGNVVICDAGNNRVIVVRRGDYDSGFSESSIVWQYGTTGVSGSGANQLVWPASAQWLTTGTAQDNVLICDQGAGRVLEVRSSDYDHFDASSVVWEHASIQPSCAVGMNGSDNVIWISDSFTGHVVAVATGSANGAPTGHGVVADFATGSAPVFTGALSAPASLAVVDVQDTLGRAGQVILVADPSAGCTVVLGSTGKPACPVSEPLSCGWRGRKRFRSIAVTYADVPMSTLAIKYQIDESGWHATLDPTISGSSGGTGNLKTVRYPLPPKTTGTTLRYEVDMSPGQHALTPRVTSLAITYQRAETSSGGGSGGGGEGGNNRGANGDGTYSYPGSKGGSGEGSGGGTGGGTGSGSGAGTSGGFGSGSSGSVTGADADASPVSGGATGQDLPDVVDPAAATASGSDAAVSGYLMKASGSAGGGEGGGASPQEGITAGSAILLPAGLGVLSLALLIGAALRERSRNRLYTGFDPGRPRALPADVTPTANPPLPPPLVKLSRQP